MKFLKKLFGGAARSRPRAEIWFKNKEDAENPMRVRMCAQRNNPPEDVMMAIYEGRYSIEPGRGGYIVKVY